jgi:hypothetical protein
MRRAASCLASGSAFAYRSIVMASYTKDDRLVEFARDNTAIERARHAISERLVP